MHGKQQNIHLLEKETDIQYKMICYNKQPTRILLYIRLTSHCNNTEAAGSLSHLNIAV